MPEELLVYQLAISTCQSAHGGVRSTLTLKIKIKNPSKSCLQERFGPCCPILSNVICFLTSERLFPHTRGAMTTLTMFSPAHAEYLHVKRQKSRKT